MKAISYKHVYSDGLWLHLCWWSAGVMFYIHSGDVWRCLSVSRKEDEYHVM